MDRRKLFTIVSGILLVGLVGVGIFFAIQSQQNNAPNDAKADDNCHWTTTPCGSGCADNGDLYSCQAGGGTPKPAPGGGVDESCGGVGKGNTTCSGGKWKVCASGQLVDKGAGCCSGTSSIACPSSGGGGSTTPPTTNACSGAGNASACNNANVGSAHAYGSGSTCVCTRTTGTLCSCVPQAGTICQVNAASTPSSCVGTGVGGACTGGTCVSAGMAGTQLACKCNLAPAQNTACQGTGTSTCTGGRICVSGQCTLPNNPGACSSDAICGAGKYCTSNGTCADKKTTSTSSSCSANNQCLSGICNGVCVSGTNGGAGTTSCTTDSNCDSTRYCNAGTCTLKKASGQNGTCSANNQCTSGLCISNVCRDGGTSGGGCTAGGVTYNNGAWKCDLDGSGNKTGQGQQCSAGSFNPTHTKTDACAPQAVGGNCATMPTYSNGESGNGRFVGCSGALNCFCPLPSGSAGTPNCIPDVGNDSCGAGTANTGGPVDQPASTGGSSSTSTTTTTTGGTTTTTPYCGDAVCATNELCERTSAGASTYKACSTVGGAPTGATVPACYGVQYNQPVASTTCKWCGDGVYTSGTEQCDASAPASGGNNPTQCDASCHLQNVANVCVSMTENGVDPIRSGASNFLQYTLIYQNNSTTNPFPNIRLLVSTGNTVATAVGRDANNTSSTLVAPIPVGGYSYDAVTSRHTYIFRWDSVSTGGVAVPDATYQVRGLTDGTDAGITTSPAACTESLTASAVAVQEPLFSIVKTGAVSCVDNSDATINYTVTVTNVGPVSGVIDQVTDTLDPLLASVGVTPTNISPVSGSYASGVITWIGDINERTFTAGQTKTYTYQVVIPVGQLLNFAAGVQNLAAVQYDTNTTSNNTASFNLRTIMNCTINGIPITGIFDDGRLFLFGLIFIIFGFVAYRYQLGKTISEKLISGAVSTAEGGIEKLMPFEDRIERKMDKRMKDEE